MNEVKERFLNLNQFLELLGYPKGSRNRTELISKDFPTKGEGYCTTYGPPYDRKILFNDAVDYVIDSSTDPDGADREAIIKLLNSLDDA